MPCNFLQTERRTVSEINGACDVMGKALFERTGPYASGSVRSLLKNGIGWRKR